MRVPTTRVPTKLPLVLGAAAIVAAALGFGAGPAAAQTAKSGIVTTSLWLPEGVTKMKGVLAFTGVGLGGGWPGDAAFRELARRLELGVITVRGEKSSGDDASYPVRCMRGEFKMLLDSLTELGKVSNHPELANVPIIGGGHSHGGDYWNYFNACYPERMALVFCKSSGGVQYSKGALRTPMVWEIGTNDLSNSRGDFRGGMFAHRSKGSPLSLVLGQGEGHGNFGAGPKQMVIELIEAIFKLRVPAGADPAAGPVTLLDIDEASGKYWLGDNYSREIGAYATFPGKAALFKTSFLPTEELAQKWKAFVPALPASVQVHDGVCNECYKQVADEAPLKPLVTGTPSNSGSAPDAGSSTPPTTETDATSPPVADAAPPVSEVKPDAATSAPSPTPSPPSMPRPTPTPTPVDDTRQPPAKAFGGCAVAGGQPAAIALPLALLGLPLVRRRRR